MCAGNRRRERYGQARTLVLRDIPEGLAIYINASSPKWQQSQERVAIQVWWPSVQIQYRIQARCEALPALHIAESWQLRPDVPKQMDWLYQQRPQSSEVNDRDELLNLLQNTQLPAPPWRQKVLAACCCYRKRLSGST